MTVVVHPRYVQEQPGFVASLIGWDVDPSERRPLEPFARNRPEVNLAHRAPSDQQAGDLGTSLANRKLEITDIDFALKIGRGHDRASEYAVRDVASS